MITSCFLLTFWRSTLPLTIQKMVEVAVHRIDPLRHDTGYRTSLADFCRGSTDRNHTIPSTEYNDGVLSVLEAFIDGLILVCRNDSTLGY